MTKILLLNQQILHKNSNIFIKLKPDILYNNDIYSRLKKVFRKRIEKKILKDKFIPTEIRYKKPNKLQIRLKQIGVKPQLDLQYDDSMEHNFPSKNKHFRIATSHKHPILQIYL